ncbi:hypothetical protein ABZP36_011236 [Zizania latifolia]
MDTPDKENTIFQDRHHISDYSTLCKGKGRATSTKRKNKPAGGFNLRKSIAWNPAFFSEQGVLDNVELSQLSGSQVKPIGSPAVGFSSTISPLSTFGKSGNTSVLKEVAGNSRGKFPAKCLSTESKGRKLFSSSKASDQDGRKAPAGTQDKKSGRCIEKSVPRSPAGYTQKKVPNSSATAQTPRMSKKSQPSLSVVSRTRSTSSMFNVPKPTKKPAAVKTEHTCKVEGLPLKSKTEHPSVTKSCGPTIGKDMVPIVTATCDEANGSRKCKTFSLYSQNSSSSSVVVPASVSAKPSALRMPSPSIGFFAQGKAPVSHGDTAQRNTERCFTGNISSVVKPPRYKQPVDLKSRPHLTKQLPTNFFAVSNLPVDSAASESTLNVLASSFPGLEDANNCSMKQSLSENSITYTSKSVNTNNQEVPAVFSLAGNGATTQQLSSKDNDDAGNGMPNECNDLSSVGRSTIKDIEPIEDTHYLKAICTSRIEPVDDSCSLKSICSADKPTVRSKLTSCISPGCTPNDLNCQSKYDNCEAAVDLENSLFGETFGTFSSSESNSCTPHPDSLRDSRSSYQHNILVESTICADQVPQCGSSSDIKPSFAYNKSDSNDSLCSEVQINSSEGPDTDCEMELDTDDTIAKESLLLHVGCECDHDYRSAEYSPMNLAVFPPYVDLEARATDLIELKADTADRKSELHHSLTEERTILSEEQNVEDKIKFDTSKLSSSEDVSNIGRNKLLGKSRENTINKYHLKNLAPFTEEWLAVMEAFGEEVLEQNTGAVQNSPTDKAAPEPSPWSPVKRKAQDVGPFDCTKYSKSVRTSDTP